MHCQGFTKTFPHASQQNLAGSRGAPRQLQGRAKEHTSFRATGRALNPVRNQASDPPNTIKSVRRFLATLRCQLTANKSWIFPGVNLSVGNSPVVNQVEPVGLFLLAWPCLTLLRARYSPAAIPKASNICFSWVLLYFTARVCKSSNSVPNKCYPADNLI